MPSAQKPRGEKQGTVTNKPVDTGDTPRDLQIGGTVELERAPSPEAEVQERALSGYAAADLAARTFAPPPPCRWRRSVASGAR